MWLHSLSNVALLLFTPNLFLRSIESSDINQTYLSWLNDRTVNQYLETRYVPQSLESLRDYWSKHRDDPNSPWFAICLRSTKAHIGNIKLGPIEWIHRRSYVSLFIGDRSCWGNGYATESITAIRDWAFLELDLQKLNACIDSSNLASRRAFEKSGFVLEGTLLSDIINYGERHDVWRMGLTRSYWSSFS